MTNSIGADATEYFSTNDVSIVRYPTRASMRDGTPLRGYRYERKTPPGKRQAPPLATPLLCLPSELGNSREYHAFAIELISLPGAPKCIHTVDLRGRGRSQSGTVSGSSTETDVDDLIAYCDAMGLHHVDLLTNGKSALVAYLAAPLRPAMIRRLILNDGGSRFDDVGIARETALRQRQLAARTWDEAISNLRQLKEAEFHNLTDENWDALAHMIWRDENGVPTPDVQDGLVRSTNSSSYDMKQPDLSLEVKILSNRPTLQIRGENSSLLTADVANQMLKIQPDLSQIVVKDQGHVPFIHLGGIPESILLFLQSE